MKYVAPIRKELGIRTVFNILRTAQQSGGCKHGADGRITMQSLVEPLAQVMANLGVARGMVVYGQDQPGRDLNECTDLCMRDQGRQLYKRMSSTPEQFGYEQDAARRSCTGRSRRQKNAQITLGDPVHGEEQGAKRQAVCLNAGAALYIAGKADTIAKQACVRQSSCLTVARHNGKLEEFIRESNAEEQSHEHSGSKSRRQTRERIAGRKKGRRRMEELIRQESRSDGSKRRNRNRAFYEALQKA